MENGFLPESRLRPSGYRYPRTRPRPTNQVSVSSVLRMTTRAQLRDLIESLQSRLDLTEDSNVWEANYSQALAM